MSPLPHTDSNRIAIPHIDGINIQIPRQTHLWIEIIIVIWAEIKVLQSQKHNMIKPLVPILGE